METITYAKLSRDNFNKYSLDNFIRYQEVKECLRKVGSEFILVPCEFIENWNLSKCRDVAKNIIEAIDKNYVVYGAFYKEQVVGFIYFDNNIFGSKNEYVELVMFQVSQPFRKKGIGKILFKYGCDDVRKTGVSKVYISAHSSRESQETYRKMGCINAIEINEQISENEPYDIQMEYKL